MNRRPSRACKNYSACSLVSFLCIEKKALPLGQSGLVWCIPECNSNSGRRKEVPYRCQESVQQTWIYMLGSQSLCAQRGTLLTPSRMFPELSVLHHLCVNNQLLNIWSPFSTSCRIYSSFSLSFTVFLRVQGYVWREEPSSLTNLGNPWRLSLIFTPFTFTVV